MGEMVGYARVSTVVQNLDAQLDALNNAGCTRIFTENASGARTDRPQLTAALDYLRPGDTLAVYRLDRLGRSLRHLIGVMTDLHERDITFRSLSEGMDTSTAGGRLVFHVFGALAEFEREMIRERTHAGLKAARARGRRGGRKRKMTPKKVALAKKMYAETDDDGKAAYTVQDIADALGVARKTIYRYVEPTGSGADSTDAHL